MRLLPGDESGRRMFWGAVALAAAILFAIQQNSGGMPFYRDRLYYFIPQYDVCRSSLAAGQVPLWNPFMFCGQPLLATWQVALGSPLALPFLIWPFHVAIQAFWFLALACAAGGMYAFGLFAGLTPFGAAIAAIVFIGAGPIRSLGEWPNIVAGLAYLPALLASITALYRGRKGGWPLFALFFAMQALAGQPRQALISYLTAAGWLGALVALERRRRILWLLLASAILAGLGIASLQLLPSFELLLFSERLAGGVAPETAKEGFLAMRDLIGVISTKFWGREGTLLGSARALQPRLYLGALSLGLIAIGLLRASRLVRLFAIFTVLPAIFLAMSEPIASLVLSLAKSAGMLRYMGHCIMAALPALSLLAGAGAQRAAKGLSPGWVKTPAPAAILLVILAPALMPGIIRNLTGGPPVQVVGIDHEGAIRLDFAVTACIFLAAWLLITRWPKRVLILMPILLFLDFFWALRAFEAKAPLHSFPRPAALDRWKLNRGRGFSPVWLTPAWHAIPSTSPRTIASRYRARHRLLAPNIPQSYGIRNASGYEPFCLAVADKMFGDYWKGLDTIADALRIAGVNWAIAPSTCQIDSLRFVGEIMPGWKLLQVPYPAPLARVVPVEAASADWRSLLRAPACGFARILDESENRICLEVETSDNSLLYIASFWVPGWKFEINGNAPRPAGRTAAGFLSLPAPAGKSRILFTYAPFSFAAGLLAASLSLAGVISLAALNYIDRRAFASMPRRRGKYQATVGRP